MERTTVRMNSWLKLELEEIAASEGKTFTEVVEEGALLRVKQRQTGLKRKHPVDLPVIGDPNGPKISNEDLKKAIEQADLEQYRKWGVIPDVSDTGR